jgi:hypothetical protein
MDWDLKFISTSKYSLVPRIDRRLALVFEPSLYYIAILVDLLLRFTWSLKLSSHLHRIAELESGVFLMECLEVMRRWLWMYFRMENAWVQKNGMLKVNTQDLDGVLQMEELISYK